MGRHLFDLFLDRQPLSCARDRGSALFQIMTDRKINALVTIKSLADLRPREASSWASASNLQTQPRSQHRVWCLSRAKGRRCRDISDSGAMLSVILLSNPACCPPRSLALCLFRDSRGHLFLCSSKEGIRIASRPSYPSPMTRLPSRQFGNCQERLGLVPLLQGLRGYPVIT